MRQNLFHPQDQGYSLSPVQAVINTLADIASFPGFSHRIVRPQ